MSVETAAMADTWTVALGATLSQVTLGSLPSYRNGDNDAPSHCACQAGKDINRAALSGSWPEIRTPSLQTSPSPSPYDKGDKCPCKCKGAIFNNLQYLHVIYIIAFLGLDFYILGLGKLPLVPGG